MKIDVQELFAIIGEQLVLIKALERELANAKSNGQGSGREFTGPASVGSMDISKREGERYNQRDCMEGEQAPLTPFPVGIPDGTLVFPGRM